MGSSSQRGCFTDFLLFGLRSCTWGFAMHTGVRLGAVGLLGQDLLSGLYRVHGLGLGNYVMGTRIVASDLL